MTVLEMFKIWEGGLSSYGGLIFGVAAGLLYVHRRKTEVMKFADAVFPYLLLGWAIGRVGCFLNWDSYGQMTSVAWGVVVDGIARHPTQIYEAIGYLASFLCVLAFFRTKHGVPAKSGNVAAASMFLFALTRFVVDFFRADPSGYLILSRVLAVTLMILALATELRTRRRTRMV
jgi:phosphatidylglycerol:prolipoprotein diacylglycerol transferase